MEDPDWLSSPSSSVAAPPSVKFTYGSKSSSSSVSVRALGPAPTAVTHESEPKKGKEQSRRPIKQTSTSSTTGATSRSVFLSDENEDPFVTLDKEQSQNTATSLQPTKGGAKSKKGQKIPSSMMDISAHEESLTKINDNNDDDDLSHRSVSSSRTESALLQALTRLSIATSSSSSISSSASARTSEKNHPSKMSTKKRGFLKDRIAQGIRKSLAPGTNISKLSSATPSSSLSRSSIPRAPHSSSSTSSSSFTSNSLTDVSSSLKNKTTKNEIVDDDDDDAISRISLPSTITDSRKARLKGRAVGFADVVSVSVSGGDLVDSDDEDCGSQHSSDTRKFGGRSRTTSFRRSSGASFSSLSTKSEYKTDDEDFNNYNNHGGNEIASDSDLDDDDTYESRNIDTEEAMKKAFRRISLAPATFAAAKACRASVSGSQSRFSAFMNEKVVEEEEEEEEEDSSVLTSDTTTTKTTTTTTTSSELVFGTILSSIFQISLIFHRNIF
jgi:hypothetical protein